MAQRPSWQLHARRPHAEWRQVAQYTYRAVEAPASHKPRLLDGRPLPRVCHYKYLGGILAMDGSCRKAAAKLEEDMAAGVGTKFQQN